MMNYFIEKLNNDIDEIDDKLLFNINSDLKEIVVDP